MTSRDRLGVGGVAGPEVHELGLVEIAVLVLVKDLDQ